MYFPVDRWYWSANLDWTRRYVCLQLLTMNVTRYRRYLEPREKSNTNQVNKYNMYIDGHLSLSSPLCHADSNNDDHISQFFDFFVQFLFGYFDASIGDTLQGLHRAFQRFETSAHFFLHFFHISHRLLIAFVEPLRNCLLDRLEAIVSLFEKCIAVTQFCLPHSFELDRWSLVGIDLLMKPFCVRTDEQHPRYVCQVDPKRSRTRYMYDQKLSLTYFSMERLISSSFCVILCSLRSRSLSSWLLLWKTWLRSSSTKARERESAVDKARAVSVSNVRRTTCCSLKIRSTRWLKVEI